MMRGVLTFALGTSLAIGLVFACTGEDVQNGDTPEGRERGPCFADKTCEGDLLCLSGTCVRADGSASTTPPGQPPGQPPGTPPPSSSDDAGIDCGVHPAPPVHTDGVRCLPGASACTTGDSCVVSNDGGMACVHDYPGDSTLEFRCFASEQCASAEICCATVANVDACNVKLTHGNCHGTCLTNEVEICAVDGGTFPARPCADGKTCVGRTATYSPSTTATRLFGTCETPPN